MFFFCTITSKTKLLFLQEGISIKTVDPVPLLEDGRGLKNFIHSGEGLPGFSNFKKSQMQDTNQALHADWVPPADFCFNWDPL